jgi:hypothetical protein
MGFINAEDILAFEEELDRKLHGAKKLELSVFESKKIHE